MSGMSLIEELARYLAEEGIGTFEGNDEGAVFHGSMPALPIKAMCVYATDLKYPGSDDGARIQILVRSNEDNIWPLEKASTIVEMLNELHDVLLVENGYYIINIDLESGPAFAGLESNATQAYSINFRVFYCN